MNTGVVGIYGILLSCVISILAVSGSVGIVKYGIMETPKNNYITITSATILLAMAALSGLMFGGNFGAATCFLMILSLLLSTLFFHPELNMLFKGIIAILALPFLSWFIYNSIHWNLIENIKS